MGITNRTAGTFSESWLREAGIRIGFSFDDLLRALSRSCHTLLGTALAAAGAVTGLSAIDAKKKKKKPCEKKCATG